MTDNPILLTEDDHLEERFLTSFDLGVLFKDDLSLLAELFPLRHFIQSGQPPRLKRHIHALFRLNLIDHVLFDF